MREKGQVDDFHKLSARHHNIRIGRVKESHIIFVSFSLTSIFSKKTYARITTFIVIREGSRHEGG